MQLNLHACRVKRRRDSLFSLTHGRARGASSCPGEQAMISSRSRPIFDSYVGTTRPGAAGLASPPRLELQPPAGAFNPRLTRNGSSSAGYAQTKARCGSLRPSLIGGHSLPTGERSPSRCAFYTKRFKIGRDTALFRHKLPIRQAPPPPAVTSPRAWGGGWGLLPH